VFLEVWEVYGIYEIMLEFMNIYLCIVIVGGNMGKILQTCHDIMHLNMDINW
jgi:hypothetical protein